MLADLAGGWLLVKDSEGVMCWVNEALGEVSEDPPNLDELRELFLNIKKKDQLMASRSDEEKDRARRRILGRNLIDEEKNLSLPPADKKSVPKEQPRLKKDFTSAEKKDAKPTNLNKAVNSPNPSNTKQGGMRMLDEVFEQTTDPKIKRGTMEHSIDEIDLEMGGLDSKIHDDDLYKYTKSTLKKGQEDNHSPYQASRKKKERQAEDSAYMADLADQRGSAEYSLELNQNNMPILEMDLDLGVDDDFGDRIQGDFITPSGKKTYPESRNNRQQQNRGKPQNAARRDQPGDNQYHMVDSGILNQMVNDIEKMQMKVSQLEQEKSNLQRENLSIVTNLKKLKEQTKTAIQNTKNQLNDKIIKRENRLEDLMRDEIKKVEIETMGQSKTNLDIQKEIQGIKELFQQSVLKNNQQNNVEKKADIQTALPMVYSHVVGQAPVQPAQQIIQHSFGVDFGRPPMQPTPMAQMGPASSMFNPSYLDKVPGQPMFSYLQQPAYNPLAGGRNVPAPGQTPETDHILDDRRKSSQQGGTTKWLTTALNEKSQLVNIKSRLHGMKLAVKAKAVEVASFEQEMNLELQRLGLPHNHSLVLKLRSNIKHQAKEYRNMVRQYENEKSKYRLKKSGVEMLEKTILFVQNAGGITKEAEKHLEEVYSSFKNLDHFGPTQDNKDFSLNSSQSQSESLDINDFGNKGGELEPFNPQEIAPQENLGELNMAKQEAPTQEVVAETEAKEKEVAQTPGSDGLAQETQIPTAFTETVELKPSNLRQSKTAQKPQGYIKGSYFNELERFNSQMSKAAPSYLMETDYTKLRDSLSYQPLSKTFSHEPAADNMKRYFQTQAKWYADIRSEVVFCDW